VNASAREPSELLALATRVAEQAADLLIEGARSVRTSVETKSTATDMVTEIDRASEDLIVTAILEAHPEDGILAEESGARSGTSGLRWVIDPLDGTTNYLYGYPSWSVSIAAESVSDPDPDGGVASGVIAGVVIDVAHREIFTATAGGGAHRDGEPIACSNQDDLARALVGTGFAYSTTGRRAQAEALVEVLPRVRDIRRSGSAAVDLCWAACGRVDAYYERGLSWWDLAAGSLIARQAGAMVSSLDPRAEAQTGSIMAATPALADPLRALLHTAGADSAW
jgi:myo-inositol-1(or 4)-monophosphatase